LADKVLRNNVVLTSCSGWESFGS